MTPQEQAVVEDCKAIADEIEPKNLGEILDGMKSEPSIDDLLARIKEMTSQRDKLTEAISAHKKALQRQIGRL